MNISIEKALHKGLDGIDVQPWLEAQTIKKITEKSKNKYFGFYLKPKYISAAACAMMLLVVFIGVQPYINNNGIIPNEYQPDVQPPAFSTPNVTGQNRNDHGANNNQLVYEESACGFNMDGKLYFPISFEQRKEFGLVDQNATGLTDENTFVITKSDFGTKMGTVKTSKDASLIGLSVYHYAAYNNSDAICIVDNNGQYEFYVFERMTSIPDTGATSDAIIAAYGISEETISKINVKSGDGILLTAITDSIQFEKIIGVLTGKVNIGNEAHELLFADWNKSNENRDAYYENQRQLLITTHKGYEINFIYNPLIRTLCTLNSYFELTNDEAAIMNEILFVNN